VFLPENI